MKLEHFLFAGMALLLVGGGVRLASIERTQGEELRRQAERQHVATWTIPAQRGDILDCQGRVLAGSLRRPSVFMDPAMIADPAAAAELIAPALGLKTKDLERLIWEKSDKRFVWVKRELTDEELTEFNLVRRLNQLQAFVVRHEPRRVYPYGRMASQVLGFAGSEELGLAGIEMEYEKVLAGVPGERTSTVDVRRRRVRSATDKDQPPIDGASVVLTIDAHLQQRTEYHLKNCYDEYKPEWASAVVMDPLSGEVLAMATLPDFDPADPIPDNLTPEQQKRALERTRNRAIADAYEPGSIFKPFIAGGALSDGVVGINDSFAVNGPTHQFGGRTIHDVHAYGTLAMHEVISKSSNIGMGMVGAKCGNDRLYRYVHDFGFGAPTGIELPGEHGGLVLRKSSWTNFSTQSVPIGQEIAVTPIQLVTAFSVFCNGGILYRPRIVRGVISAAGETLEDHSQPVEVRRVMTAESATTFRMKALVETVNSGTGKAAQLADYQVFGKTGTAQVARSDGHGYIPGAYVGSFLAGAPAEQPRVVVLVSVYRPTSGKYYGGTVAAPTVAAIIADTLEYMQAPAEPPAVGLKPSRDGGGLAWAR
jgi:cell division protein FtsI (penicillin-binding protein 3)